MKMKADKNWNILFDQLFVFITFFEGLSERWILARGMIASFRIVLVLMIKMTVMIIALFLLECFAVVCFRVFKLFEALLISLFSSNYLKQICLFSVQLKAFVLGVENLGQMTRTKGTQPFIFDKNVVSYNSSFCSMFSCDDV